jgi:hypothetical protein
MLFKVFDEIENIENKLSVREKATNKKLMQKGEELKKHVRKIRKLVLAMKNQPKANQAINSGADIAP